GVLSDSTVRSLNICQIQHFNDSIADEINTQITNLEVIILTINSSCDYFMVKTPEVMLSSISQVKYIFLSVLCTSDFMGMCNDFWDNLFRVKRETGSIVIYNYLSRFDENTDLSDVGISHVFWC
ncbi:hypothetical protein PFISCL1PPCAC_12466, partial [Pristionchus fissidentatus]